MSTELIAQAATTVAEKTAETATGTLLNVVSKHPIEVAVIAAGTLCTLAYLGTRKGAEISIFGFKAKGPV